MGRRHFFLFVSFLLFAALQRVLVVAADKAAAFHSEALHHVNNGDLDLALANFRAACRLNNASALLWNDLGVTEMRVGLLQRAEKRFLKALRIDPFYATASDNLRELQQHTGASGEVRHETREQKHSLRPPRELSPAEFMRLSVHGAQQSAERSELMARPFVVRGFVPAAWRANSTRFSPAVLAQQFASRRTDYYPHNMLEEQAHPYFLSLGSALQQLSAPQEVFVGVDASEPGTYLQWNLDQDAWDQLLGSEAPETCSSFPALLDDEVWASCLGAARDAFWLGTHWRMLLVGEAGAGMFNHRDLLRTASYQVTFEGRKRWHLCAPSQSGLLYGAGDVDLFAPDYARFPLARRAQCLQTTVGPGDLLYYPADYWHQTLNLDTPTVALTGTLVTAANHRLVADELRKECGGMGRIFPPNQILCGYLDQCFVAWADMFNGYHQ